MKMPSLNDLKQSKFLKQSDVPKPLIVTIYSYGEVNVAKEGAEEDMKWALNFKELSKPLILNSTNGQIIAEIAGTDDFDGWLGTKVVLYTDPNVMYAGKRVGGLRIRAPRTAQIAPPLGKPADNADAVAKARQAKLDEVERTRQAMAAKLRGDAADEAAEAAMAAEEVDPDSF
jgi:hypothetical protein